MIHAPVEAPSVAIRAALSEQGMETLAPDLRKIFRLCDGVAGERLFNEIKHALVERVVEPGPTLKEYYDSEQDTQQDIAEGLREAAAILGLYPAQSIPMLASEAVGGDVNRAGYALKMFESMLEVAELSPAHLGEIKNALTALISGKHNELKGDAKLLLNDVRAEMRPV